MSEKLTQEELRDAEELARLIIQRALEHVNNLGFTVLVGSKKVPLRNEFIVLHDVARSTLRLYHPDKN